jgi:hypothetical protein
MSAIDMIFGAVATPWVRGVSLAVAVAAGWGLAVQGRVLETDAAPKRVVSLELARTAEKAGNVIKSWENKGARDVAVQQIQLDFIFIVAYTTLLVAVALSSERAAAAAGIGWLQQLSHYAAFAGIAAGILDCLENIGMLIMLGGTINDPIAAATWFCAAVKFILAIAVSLIALAAFVLI